MLEASSLLFYTSENWELQIERQFCGYKVNFVAAKLSHVFCSSRSSSEYLELQNERQLCGLKVNFIAGKLPPVFCSFKSKVAAARVCVCSFWSTFSASSRHKAAAASSCRISAMILKFLNTLEREGTSLCDRLLLFVRVSVFGSYSL